MGFAHVEIERDGHVATVWLNRPDKLNALSDDIWADLPTAISEVDADDGVRVIVLAGRGKAFTVGIDIGLLASIGPTSGSHAVASQQTYETVTRLQKTVSCLADTAKPVIAAIHGYCLGAGASLISAADIRLASADASISIRETKMGLVADIGALQRLPAIVGDAVTAEMALTGDDYSAAWALEKGLVSRVFEDREALMEGAHDLALRIAVNSPLITQGIKRVLQANEGRTMEQRLDFMARWNAAYVVSNDLVEAMAAFVEKRDPNYTGT